MHARRSAKLNTNPGGVDFSNFQAAVYALVRRIPAGRVMTYGQIAACIPTPGGIDPLAYARVGPRWAGYAMAACPDDVPWHRVVNARGRISQRAGHGPHLQRSLLKAEGVDLDPAGTLDLERLRWSPDECDT